MFSPLCPTVGVGWLGSGGSAGHGCVSLNRDNTSDRWGTELVSAGGEQNKLAIDRFGA